MNPVHWLLEGIIDIPAWSALGVSAPASALLVREVVGNAFGLASAIGGLRRRIWAWPVGIVGNLVLFTVFVGGILDKPQTADLWGQAGRQVFFLAVSLYGWSRWRRSAQLSPTETGDQRAITPRWAGPAGWLQLAVLAIVGTTVFYFVLKSLGSWGPLPDAWILTGSILATYGMARGWNEFWLIWIAVDVVGVPLLFQAGYYPSAVLYLVYGGFCIAGFVAWLRAQRAAGEPEPTSPRTPEQEKVAA
ncbi:MAG: nicotinamide riboside transporter PnuC [Nocardioides sp.]